MQILDLAIISDNQQFNSRIKVCADLFAFSHKSYRNDEEFFTDAESYKGISCIVIDCSKIAKPNEVAGTVQVARQAATDSYILAVASSKFLPEDARVVKTSGASIVIMENEFFTSSKIEFILTQVIRSAYIPIKAIDLFPDSVIPHPLYYLMPLNQKFLKVAKPGMTLSSEFIDKYKETGELYIPRGDLPLWAEYTNTYSATEDEASYLRKCRLKFLQLNQSFLELVLMVSDQSSGASFSKGKDLYDVCVGFASELLQALRDIKNPWAVVNNSAIGDFGSVERAPVVAAYAGLLGEEAKIGNPMELMIGALLSDIGLIDISPSTTKKIRTNSIDTMNSEETMEYEKHPIFSLNQCLSRKLPLSEMVKNIILQSHERNDQKGFPNRPRGDKLSEDAMLVQLCWDLDSISQVRMGEERKNIEDIKKHIYQKSQSDTGRYSFMFLMKIGKVLSNENSSETFAAK